MEPSRCPRLHEAIPMNRYDDIYNRLEHWLLTHIASMGSTNGGCRQAFELKRIHSLKVADETVAIGRGLGLEPPALFLARTIGLLHDVGRFEQYRTYGTFNDFTSIDHGDLGERTVAANGLLDDFDPFQREIIRKTIRYHNKMSLPSDESEAVLFHAKLIRDADKLDIYRVVSEREVVPGALPSQNTIAESLLEDLMAGKKVGYMHLKSAAEMRLMHISWIFDINFEPTLRLIQERNYLEILSAILPSSERIDAFVRKARQHLAAQKPPAS
ncbi:MAG: HD domain-containing protein [Desulfobacteraceae bacterium]|nr:MAG: HD domain-containing protein [Desulfobacteraceae bacterium]